MRDDAQIEKARVEKEWMPYPENKPYTGWCATTDGGDIVLEFWNGDGWMNKNRDILEFMQVTVNA